MVMFRIKRLTRIRKPEPIQLMSLMWVLVGLCSVVSWQYCGAHYLRASSRWLVRESDGQRVKLACVNWAGHLETMLPEGLNRQPLYRLGLGVKGLGFNCIRLTYASYMFTNPTLAKLTVTESFTRLNLQHTLHGIAIHNPDLLKLPITVAFARIVEHLTRAGLLIILDNHVSKPQWCCTDKDGNGFWGDTYFGVDSWVQGLTIVASLFKDYPEVVAMSLRNELRGPKQNTQQWYEYMSLGANAVHKANPNVIIIMSGLRYDTDLRFLFKTPLSHLTFRDKVIFEMHWYTSSYGINFAKGNLNKACAIATSSIMECGGYMVAPPFNGSFTAPLFVSEFGIDQRGGNKANNSFINCFFAFMASMDLDWAYWPLQGSYYVRNHREGDEEFYGVLNSQWNAPRNMSLLTRLQTIQQPWQLDVNNSKASTRGEHGILFHPASGLCVQKGSHGGTLLLGPCTLATTTRWSYVASDGRLEMAGSYLCIASDGEGQPAKLQSIGTQKNGPWTLASVAKLQFSTLMQHTHIAPPHLVANDQNNHDGFISNNKANADRQESDDQTPPSYVLSHLSDDGKHLNINHALCLDGSNPPSITTKKCICIQDDEMDCGPYDDPSSQWFVLVPSSTHLGMRYRGAF